MGREGRFLDLPDAEVIKKAASWCGMGYVTLHDILKMRYGHVDKRSDGSWKLKKIPDTYRQIIVRILSLIMPKEFQTHNSS